MIGKGMSNKRNRRVGSTRKQDPQDYSDARIS